MEFRRAPRPPVWITAGLLVAIGLGPLALASHAAEPPATNQLQDISVFKDQLLGTWSGGDIVAPDTRLPVDTAQVHEGLPSLRFDVYGPSGWWWLTILAGQDWHSYSVEHYRASGFLEFNVKGAAGGERFKLGLVDVDQSRTPVEKEQWVDSSSFVTVTTEWQHVRIPLASLIPAGADFNARQFQSVRFGETYAGPYAKTFWINDLKFTSPDREPSAPTVRVNQAGYLPKGRKYAFVAGFPEVLAVDEGAGFEVRREEDHSVAFRGRLRLVDAHERFVSGEKVLEADFGELSRPGRYYVNVDGLEPSAPFEIGRGVFAPVLRDTVRYYYYQRQGIAIEEPYAEGFARGLGHPGDANAVFRSSGAPRDVSQGWYDAGDYGKYTPMAAQPIVDLLAAYEAFPEVFGDATNIPESGNEKPDLLDEVKWELDWLLKMQDAQSGGFYHLIYPNNCPGSGSCRPEDVTEQRYIEDLIDGTGNVRPTASTAKAVAALARAARVYRKYDKDYAARLLAAARAGWGYLEANPQNIRATGFNGEQATDDADRLWAAAELFRTTKEPRYDTYFLERYQAYESVWASRTDNAGETPMRAFVAYNSAPSADGRARRWFRERYRAWREHQLERTKGTWRNFLADGSDDASDYYWGSNSVTLQTIVVMALADKADQEEVAPDLVQAAHAQLDYVLGVNPLGKSYVTGYGANDPKQLYSHIYSHDAVTELPRGILVEGPNQYQGGTYSRFFGKCYEDTNTDWTVSEHGIYFNANLAFVLALVDASAGGDRGGREKAEGEPLQDEQPQ
jgi:hypothetical protein